MSSLILQSAYFIDREKNTQKKLNNLLNFISNGQLTNTPSSVLEEINKLDIEKKEIQDQIKDLKQQLSQPTIAHVSLEQIKNHLTNFSKILPNLKPEQQKDFLHTIIKEITVNSGSSPSKRTIKHIELFFDTSSETDFVLTYDKDSLH
ncbi:hypothetical protein [Marinococcus sp. PL1-022]|uniref:hypothetical protein n=1 Tax=Marinococcus sp. PL1-022 TaxID=3095363 RepID=UPI0029C53AF6|nr:hypothetical protein [Marinococcus sp. PL1-022]MDX6154325.1 hypothetical protein [Marinococcus sp. PL1-022]